jgi:hypothetical protein
MGFAWVRESWDAGAALVGFHHNNSPWVDHYLKAPHNVQIYRRGERAVTHTIGYDVKQTHQNALLVRGMPFNGEACGRTAFDASASYVYAVGTQGGNSYEGGYWDPPPRFIHEATRSYVYLPASDGKSVTVVVHDRVNADNPTRFDRFRGGDQTTVQTWPHKRLLWHTPVSPTISGGTISHGMGSGQQVRYVGLTPGLSIASQAVTTGFTGGTVFPSELRFVAMVTPTVTRKWDTFLTVVQAYDPGSVGGLTRVTSADGYAEGAVVARAGHNDTLVVFNARQAADLPPDTLSNQRLVRKTNLLQTIDAGRRHAAGYDLTYTQATGTAQVLLADLNPAKAWTVQVDANPAQALSVSAAGMAKFTVSGTGGHTIKVR